MTGDFARFRDELIRFHRTLSGEASLSGYEPNLKVKLTADVQGHVFGDIEITPDDLTQGHHFEIGFDQSYLPALIASCDALIERYPVIGRPDA